MSQNPSSGFDNIISGAQGFFGGNQTASTTQATKSSGGLMDTAQNLLGGQSQPQNQYSQINNTIDTAQSMMGHTGQGGPGIHGYVDSAQSLTGHKGPVGGVQGALNTAQGMQGLQKISGDAQKAGLGNLANTAGGLLGQGQPGKTGAQQGSSLGGINSTIDSAQAMMGHTGQGGPGFQGTIDKAQGLLGSGQPTHQTQQGSSSLGGISSTIDSAQAMMGHTGQGGPGIHGTIDQAQGLLGQTGQAGAKTAQTGKTAQTATRNAANTANTAARDVPQKKHKGLHGLFDKAKGLFGHHHHTDTA